MKLFKRNKGVLVEENKNDKITQMTELLKHLESGKTITSKEAFERFGITRLSARIYDLRHKEGLNIITRNKIVETRYGRKTMVAEYILVRSKRK